MENQNESQNNKKEIQLNKLNINDIHQTFTNALTNQFLIASLTNSVLMNMTNNGPFYAPNLNSKRNIPGPYESYKTFLISKDRLEMKKIILIILMMIFKYFQIMNQKKKM